MNWNKFPDTALLRALVDGHSKASKEFYYLELGVLMLRHKATIRRLMYHKQILDREDSETTKKLYNKQKENFLKGDWYRTLMKDFKFIEENADDEAIKSMSMIDFKRKVKIKVQEAAFKYYKTLQKKHKKTKLIIYEKHIIQPYLTNNMFNKEEIKMLILTRSRCHPAKMNFEKLNKFNLSCSFKCKTNETQEHIFKNCDQINMNMKTSSNLKIENIFFALKNQREVAVKLVEKENIRKMLLNELEPSANKTKKKKKKKKKPLPGELARTEQNR